MERPRIPLDFKAGRGKLWIHRQFVCIWQIWRYGRWEKCLCCIITSQWPSNISYRYSLINDIKLVCARKLAGLKTARHLFEYRCCLETRDCVATVLPLTACSSCENMHILEHLQEEEQAVRYLWSSSEEYWLAIKRSLVQFLWTPNQPL